MIDVRNPGDGFAALRSRIGTLGPLPDGDRGVPGAPLTVGEWALLIDDIVDHPQDNTEGLWNVAAPSEDDREYDAIFVGGGASRPVRLGVPARPRRPPADHRRLAVPGRVVPAPGVRAASPVLRVPPASWTWPGTCRAGCGTRSSTRSGPASWRSRPVQGGPDVPARHHELAVQGTARHGVHPQHAGHGSSTSTRSRWRASGSTARNLVLCTGARTVYPDVPGIGIKGVYDFATLIEDLDYEPNRCVIIGGSKVALEYGSFFQATGCQTTILTRSPLMQTASLHHVDAGLREYVVAMMADRGIEIVEGAEPLEVLGNGKVTGVRYRAPRRRGPADRHRLRVRRHRGAAQPRHVRATGAGDRRARVRHRRQRTCGPRCRVSTRPATWSARRWRCSRRASAASARPATSWARTTSSTSPSTPTSCTPPTR